MKSILLIAAVLLLTLVASIAAYFAGSAEEAAIRAAAVGLLTLIVTGGSVYLVLYTLAMKRLSAEPSEAGQELSAAIKSARAVHYKSGNPARFWEAVGGMLLLSDEALEFRANPMEWWKYQISIPLTTLRQATACKIGLAPGGLRVEREDGSFELFTFGAAFDVSRQWADAIVAQRDQLGKRPT